MSQPGDNLVRVLSAWLAMQRGGHSDELAMMLDEQVTWQGILADQVCCNRDEVLDVLVRNRPRVPRLTRIEAEETGDRVALSVAGPDFPDTETHRASDPRRIVFIFREGRVVRMESRPSRDAAFEMVAG